LTIDRYSDHLYLARYAFHDRSTDEAAVERRDEAPGEPLVEPPFELLGDREDGMAACLQVVASVLRVDPQKIHLKQRRLKAEPEQQYQKLAEEKSLLVVREGGLRFYVNLTDYLDTGLFLDHRKTREKFRELAAGARVLNLFCYTGAFSVYAADGAAKEIVSVDLSNTYLNWAQRNLALNRLFDPAKHRFERADVLQYLQDAPDDYFDLVILDPPTFSNSKAMRNHLDIQRDHGPLINQTLRSMVPGGTLYFSTNCRKFRLDRSGIESDFVKDITHQTVPFDFPDRLQRWCFVIRKTRQRSPEDEGHGQR
jgi:23S rRNA (cytosine1962-C5)-methyltransferase